MPSSAVLSPNISLAKRSNTPKFLSLYHFIHAGIITLSPAPCAQSVIALIACSIMWFGYSMPEVPTIVMPFSAIVAAQANSALAS